MDIRSIRLNNLKHAVLEAGGVDRLAERAGVSRKYLDQILQGFQGKRDKNPRRVGDALAGKISLGLGLHDSWMDQPHPDLWRALGTTSWGRARGSPGRAAAVLQPCAAGRAGPRQRPDFPLDTGGAMGNGLELRDQPGVIQSWNVSPEWLQRTSGASRPRRTCASSRVSATRCAPCSIPAIPDRGPGRAGGRVRCDLFLPRGQRRLHQRLQRIPTATGLVVRAKSENTKYDAWDITEGMDFEVFGRVLKVWRSEDF